LAKRRTFDAKKRRQALVCMNNNWLSSFDSFFLLYSSLLCVKQFYSFVSTMFIFSIWLFVPFVLCFIPCLAMSIVDYFFVLVYYLVDESDFFVKLCIFYVLH
jgi:hypothetical protein